MRLSVLYRRPLSEVLSWPLSHLRLIGDYLAREPAPEERIEIAIAQLTAIYVNSKIKAGSTAKKVIDFLLFRDAFKAKPSQQDINNSFLRAFGSVSGPKRRARPDADE